MTHSGESYERGPNNPNGLFEAIMSPEFAEQVPDVEKRLAYAAADIQIYLMDVVKVDKEMANLVAARALQEVLATVEITLPAQTLRDVLESADLHSPEQRK